MEKFQSESKLLEAKSNQKHGKSIQVFQKPHKIKRRVTFKDLPETEEPYSHGQDWPNESPAGQKSLELHLATAFDITSNEKIGQYGSSRGECDLYEKTPEQLTVPINSQQEKLNRGSQLK